ncbi:MAG: histidine--tRNA ligase [Rickettsiales bacterium]|nr:histidine--tRNA ligase [Pseudomonadota bacterium]MDA0967163.1 histidine--tRNA ligase [Pseudomonadota bacterium]MDG4544348.1 histidine--tRNA ligase [Rickettsiales bacterium]MDG4546478.1 histidine--tRNA ligase [Rickettsiales bacterium]MDG4548624.1 histidine--tRNA ligase [Rickettsiales bacterium]
MSHKLQPVRGTKDILSDEFRVFSHVQNTARKVSSLYGFKEISTPIFEFTEVFAKTLGEESDVVGKEMYIFEDRGGESITLRPEFTAGIARAFISGGLTNQLPLKLFSTGPLFRYERPQKGRQRQFHQINFEMLGVADYTSDVEVISMAAHILEALGVSDKIKLEINSLGDKESREKYRDALVDYLNDYKNELSDDSKIRLEKNPMRILDSKDEGDKKIVENAPSISEYYSNEAAEFFANVKSGLESPGVNYSVNSRLVRGLDYYCHTAFEFTTDALGSQNAVLAGGRYDGLISMMGGADTPAVGFAGGVERLVALFGKEIPDIRPVVLIPIGENAEKQAALLAGVLRKEGIYIELGYSGNVKKRMKRANGMNAKAAVIFGDDEIKNKVAKVKDFDSGEEVDISVDKLVDKVRAI